MAQKIVPGKASGKLITENELGEECCWWWWWKWANNSRQVPRKERDFLNPTEEKFLVFPSPTSTSLREHHGNCQFPKSFTSLSIFFFFPIHTRLLVNWKVARDNTMWTWTCVEFSFVWSAAWRERFTSVPNHTPAASSSPFFLPISPHIYSSFAVEIHRSKQDSSRHTILDLEKSQQFWIYFIIKFVETHNQDNILRLRRCFSAAALSVSWQYLWKPAVDDLTYEGRTRTLGRSSTKFQKFIHTLFAIIEYIFAAVFTFLSFSMHTHPTLPQFNVLPLSLAILDSISCRKLMQTSQIQSK